MNSSLKLLLAICLTSALAGCPSEGGSALDEVRDADDVSCATVGNATISACAWDPDFPWGEELVGTFQSWGPGTHTFDLTGGGSWDIEVSGRDVDFVLLPNLRDSGEIALTLSGGCDPKGGAASTLLATSPTDDTDVALFLGNVVEGSGGGWTVETPRDTTSCPDGVGEEDPACGCHTTCHPKPTYFAGPAGSASLSPSQAVEIGDHSAFVFIAWSGEGPQCSDVGDEVQTWAVVKTTLLD